MAMGHAIMQDIVPSAKCGVMQWDVFKNAKNIVIQIFGMLRILLISLVAALETGFSPTRSGR